MAHEAALEVAKGVEGAEGLEVVVAPDSTLVALAADETCDVFTVADEMSERGWLVQPQMSFAGQRPTLHLSLCAATAPRAADLVEALGESAAAARAAGPVVVDPQLAAAAAALDPATLDDAAFDGLLAIARRAADLVCKHVSRPFPQGHRGTIGGAGCALRSRQADIVAGTGVPT